MTTREDAMFSTIKDLEAEVKRLESEASARYQAGIDFGRQEARRMVEELASHPFMPEGQAKMLRTTALYVWPDPKADQ